MASDDSVVLPHHQLFSGSADGSCVATPYAAFSAVGVSVEGDERGRWSSGM